VEILQNCPVFNDGEFEELEDASTRAVATLPLRHGEPLVFGPEGARRGIVLDGFRPEIIELGDDDDPRERGVLLHDEQASDSGLAFLLAQLHRPRFPEAIGVLRAVERATYEQLLGEQVETERHKRGAGELAALLRSADTWQVA